MNVVLASVFANFEYLSHLCSSVSVVNFEGGNATYEEAKSTTF